MARLRTTMPRASDAKTTRTVDISKLRETLLKCSEKWNFDDPVEAQEVIDIFIDVGGPIIQRMKDDFVSTWREEWRRVLAELDQRFHSLSESIDKRTRLFELNMTGLNAEEFGDLSAEQLQAIQDGADNLREIHDTWCMLCVARPGTSFQQFMEQFGSDPYKRKALMDAIEREIERR